MEWLWGASAAAAVVAAGALIKLSREVAHLRGELTQSLDNHKTLHEELNRRIDLVQRLVERRLNGTRE